MVCVKCCHPAETSVLGVSIVPILPIGEIRSCLVNHGDLFLTKPEYKMSTAVSTSCNYPNNSPYAAEDRTYFTTYHYCPQLEQNHVQRVSLPASLAEHNGNVGPNDFSETFHSVSLFTGCTFITRLRNSLNCLCSPKTMTSSVKWESVTVLSNLMNTLMEDCSDIYACMRI